MSPRAARPPVFACDIDNTVADQLQRYRKFFDPRTQTLRPGALHARVILGDAVLPGAVEANRRLSARYRIVFLSARKPAQRGVTLRWLKQNGFVVHGLFLVGQNDNKIPVLQRLRPHVFVDDMRYNWEHLDPKPAFRFMRRLRDLGIRYDVFRGNWPRLADKYSEFTR